jgi:PmbA protein
MPVILAPRASLLLLLPLQLGFNGKNVLKGDSPLAGRLGDKIASDAFSLTDDATIDYTPRSEPFDGEGVGRRPIPVIENGRLNAFLYDLETAGKAGVESTGSGPGCGPSNLLIAPGAVSFADMIAGTEEGLLVHHVMGLGQSNIINGDFSVNVSLGYKIENGEIVGRVKDVMLAGNVYDALHRIEAIGSEPEWFMANHAPPIKLSSLSVVAKS